jgi:hypothetical protein
MFIPNIIPDVVELLIKLDLSLALSSSKVKLISCINVTPELDHLHGVIILIIDCNRVAECLSKCGGSAFLEIDRGFHVVWFVNVATGDWFCRGRGTGAVFVEETERNLI